MHQSDPPFIKFSLSILCKSYQQLRLATLLTLTAATDPEKNLLSI